MPDPRLIFVRHGQTEWSKSGQHTSITDLDLTDVGVAQMRATGQHLIGDSPLSFLNVNNVKCVITSPRKRAKETAKYLFEGTNVNVPVTEDDEIREWEYGDYEGLLTAQIVKLRKERGLDKERDWSIWEDGCENGEDYKQVTKRVDSVIAKIRDIHRQAFATKEPCDVVLVAHGHILRCLAARWVGKEINENPQFVLDAGSVGVLTYQHHNIDEPAISLGGAFRIPVDEA